LRPRYGFERYPRLLPERLRGALGVRQSAAALTLGGDAAQPNGTDVHGDVHPDGPGGRHLDLERLGAGVADARQAELPRPRPCPEQKGTVGSADRLQGVTRRRDGHHEHGGDAAVGVGVRDASEDGLRAQRTSAEEHRRRQ
jgi:hypothetical protein